MSAFDMDIRPTLCLAVQPGYAQWPARCQENYGHAGAHRDRWFRGPSTVTFVVAATWANEDEENVA